MRAWLQRGSLRAFLILALAIDAVLPARARLGETEPETLARYGPATAVYEAGTAGHPFRTLTFDHAGYTIIAQFIDGSCEMVCFQKPGGSEFTEDDLDLILKTEAGDQVWTRSNLVSIDLIWNRPDGARARYDTQAHALGFFSARYIEANDAHRSEEKKKKLESL